MLQDYVTRRPYFRVPGAVQRSFSGAPQTRDPSAEKMGPGSVMHHSRAASRPGHDRLYSVPMGGSFFVYILASKKNGTLYVGVTNDLARRMTEHKAKLVPGFTRQYSIDRLVYFETFESILEARARERALKCWRRAWKITLIEKLNPEWNDLSDQLNS